MTSLQRSHTQLVLAQVPGSILGLAPKKTVRWAALAARDWSQYVALRGANPAPSDTIPRWESKP
jgi:hypothetical protein